MRWSSRSRPCSADVTVRAPGFCTPRSDMHMCSGLEDDTDALWREMLQNKERCIANSTVGHCGQFPRERLDNLLVPVHTNHVQRFDGGEL